VLASKGVGGAKCKLSAVQLRELEAVLDAGPAAVCTYNPVPAGAEVATA
jgi:hypothetical protein